MKCLICENLYPPHYKECPICDNNLVKEVFAPQIKKDDELEEVEPISALCVDGDICIGEV